MELKLIYNFERKDYAVYFGMALLDVADDLAEALQTFLVHVTDVKIDGEDK